MDAFYRQLPKLCNFAPMRADMEQGMESVHWFKVNTVTVAHLCRNNSDLMKWVFFQSLR